jgi:hypothetical protein
MLIVRFEVLTEATMKATVLWDIVPCSLAEADRRSQVPAASFIKDDCVSRLKSRSSSTRRHGPISQNCPLHY